MIFKDSTQYNSHYFPFNWGVDYVNGGYLTEFDMITKEKNNFYDIIQQNISRFGLYGCGMKFYYSQDGSFNLQGQRIELEYHTEDKIFQLTNSFTKKDCITYKKKDKWYNHNYELQSEYLVSIDFGYKTTLNFDDIELHFQPIIIIPLNEENGEVKIEVKVTSNTDMNGKLIIKNKGSIIDSEDYPLFKNHSSTITWVVQ